MAASYPAAVKTFASKATSDTIQASHVNDLQDEVNAIEAGLLNGTAVLNSSNASVVNLSVSGNSTIAGNVTITGSLTIGANPVSARVFHSTIVGVANGANQVIPFDSEDFKTAGTHSTVTNNTRLVPVSSGVYLIGAQVQWSGNDSGYRNLVIRIDGSSAIVQDIRSAITGIAVAQTVQTLYRFASTTQYAEVYAVQNSGSTMSLSTQTGYAPVFWFTRIS